MEAENKTYLKIFLNSTAFFLLAYLLIYLFSQLLTLIAALAFNFDVVWKYYGLIINVGENQWTAEAVKTIFSAAPVFQLIFGFACAAVYFRFRELTGMIKQFFFWGFMLSFHLFFVNILIGGLVNKGFGYVLQWSYLADTGRLFHVLFGLFGLVLTGYLGAKSLVISVNSYFNEVRGLRKLHVFLFQFLFPFIAGLILIYLIRIPYNHYNDYLDLISIAAFLFVCIFVFIRLTHLEDLMFDEEEKKPYIFRQVFLVLGIVLILYRLGLGIGVNLG